MERQAKKWLVVDILKEWKEDLLKGSPLTIDETYIAEMILKTLDL